MIHLEAICKSFGPPGKANWVLRDINLQIQAGEIFGILGPSGAGKSTLLRTINLLAEPDDGKVLIDGINLFCVSPKKLREMRAQIGMIFQHFNLLSSLTVAQNIALPLKFTLRPQAKRTVEAMLALTGLTEFKDAYPHQLSGGQKQRVAIARALVTQPKILLCDEATSALDPESTKQILTLLRDINESFNITVVMVSHELEVVKNICHRVALLKSGAIIELGPTLDFFTQPQTELGARFVATYQNEQLGNTIRSMIHPEPAPGAATIIRLNFVGQVTHEPVIHRLIKDINVGVNILGGNIDEIQKHLLGTLIIELSGSSEQQHAAMNLLNTENIHCTVLGYVH